MANVDDINLAIETSKSAGNNYISLLQCTSLYPAPLDSLNLSAICWLKERYGYDVGFSDHSLGSDAAFLSVGAGATLIEKHFSLDPSQPGFDHKISLSLRIARFTKCSKTSIQNNNISKISANPCM